MQIKTTREIQGHRFLKSSDTVTNNLGREADDDGKEKRRCASAKYAAGTPDYIFSINLTIPKKELQPRRGSHFSVFAF